MRKVLTIVKATLTDLKLAIDGTIIMNEVRICIYVRIYGIYIYVYTYMYIPKSYSVPCNFNVCNQVLISDMIVIY